MRWSGRSSQRWQAAATAPHATSEATAAAQPRPASAEELNYSWLWSTVSSPFREPRLLNSTPSTSYEIPRAEASAKTALTPLACADPKKNTSELLPVQNL